MMPEEGSSPLPRTSKPRKYFQTRERGQKNSTQINQHQYFEHSVPNYRCRKSPILVIFEIFPCLRCKCMACSLQCLWPPHEQSGSKHTDFSSLGTSIWSSYRAQNWMLSRHRMGRRWNWTYGKMQSGFFVKACCLNKKYNKWCFSTSVVFFK